MIDNDLVPVHELLSEEEANAVLAKYGASIEELPRITKTDPGIAHLEAVEGQVVKIIRANPVIGKTVHYRAVVEE